MLIQNEIHLLVISALLRYAVANYPINCLDPWGEKILIGDTFGIESKEQPGMGVKMKFRLCLCNRQRFRSSRRDQSECESLAGMQSATVKSTKDTWR